MLGLFKKENTGISIKKSEYKTKTRTLIALLEQDLKLIDEERKKLKQAIRELNDSGKKIEQSHIETIKARLDLIRNNLIAEDKIAIEQTGHVAAETIELSQLNEIADQIIKTMNQQQNGNMIKKGEIKNNSNNSPKK